MTLKYWREHTRTAMSMEDWLGLTQAQASYYHMTKGREGKWMYRGKLEEPISKYESKISKYLKQDYQTKIKEAKAYYHQHNMVWNIEQRYANDNEAFMTAYQRRESYIYHLGEKMEGKVQIYWANYKQTLEQGGYSKEVIEALGKWFKGNHTKQEYELLPDISKEYYISEGNAKLFSEDMQDIQDNLSAIAKVIDDNDFWNYLKREYNINKKDFM